MQEATDSKRRKFLAWTLLLISIIYIGCELIFNALLLDTASSRRFDIDRFEHIEILGRALSGIGVSLLLISLLKNALSKSLFHLIFGSTLIVAIAWPTAFFAQKILVDRLIIDSADAQQLKQATTANVFKQALAADALVIENLNYDAINDGPANKTFIALFSSLVLFGDSDADFIQRNMEQVIGSYVNAMSREQRSEWLTAHQRAYDDISHAYQQEYLTGSREYNEKQQNLSLEVTQAMAEVERSVQDIWGGYQDALKRREEEALRQAKEHSPELIRYFSTYNSRCFRNGNLVQRCANEARRQYYAALADAGIGRVDSRFWMPYREGSFLSRAGNLLLDLTTHGYNYSTDISHYQKRFLALPEGIARFERSTGYPIDIDNFHDFRAHPQTSARLRTRLTETGIALPNNWQIDDTAALRIAMQEHVQGAIEDEWSSRMRAQGLSVPPNLTWPQFESHPSVQDKLSDTLGELYVRGYRVSWSDAEFQRRAIRPLIEKQEADLLAQWRASVVEFKLGGRYHELGRSNIRAAVVPPIAMFLSLLLIAFNVLKFPRELFAAMFTRKSTKRSLLRHGISFGYVLVLFLLIIMLPLKLVDNPLAQDSDPITAHFMEQVDQNTGPLASFALNWVLHAQPILYPAGKYLEGHLDLFNASAPMVPMMLDWDKVVLDRK